MKPIQIDEKGGDTSLRHPHPEGSAERLERVKRALEANGFSVEIAENEKQALEISVSSLPKGGKVLTMSSVTLDKLGITERVNSGEEFVSVRKEIFSLDKATQGEEMRILRSAPQAAIGSVQAVTLDGTLVLASASGSQLPAYAFSSEKVVLVVGSQKIVKDLGEAIERIEKHVFPLEDKRALSAYGVHSSINKLLVLRKEPVEGRTKVILLREPAGF